MLHAGNLGRTGRPWSASLLRLLPAVLALAMFAPARAASAGDLPLAPRPAELDGPTWPTASSAFDVGVAEAAQGAGHWASAYNAFNRSVRAHDHPHTEYNRALCAERLGNLTTARHGFDQVLKDADARAPNVAAWVVESARQHIKALDEQVGRVILSIDQIGVDVVVDGTPLQQIRFDEGRTVVIPAPPWAALYGTLPGEMEVLLDPGRKHLFVISKPGFEEDTFDVEASSGKAVTIERTLHRKSHLVRNLGFAGMITGGVAVVAAVFVAAQGTVEIKTLTDQYICSDSGKIVHCADGASASQYRAGDRKLIAGEALGATGAALVLGGAVTALLAAAPWRKPASKLPVALSPAISVGVNGLFVSGRF